MNGFLVELGKRLAERWLSLLVLPGALFLGVLAAGRELGDARWYAVGELPARVDRRTGTFIGTTGDLLLFFLAFVLAAAACGLAAQALGSLAERVWLADDWHGWPRATHGLVRRLIARRERIYAARSGEAATAVARAELAETGPDAAHGAATAVSRMRRVADARPVMPTWAGDRLRAVETRLLTSLGIRVAVIWPQLWLHAPDSTRTEIGAAREELRRAATLAGWGLLYVTVGAVWWPGAVIGGAVVLTAWHRFRTATDAYATLIESAVRLHVHELARALGIGGRGPLTAAHGAALDAYLATGEDPPPDVLLPRD